MRSTPSLQYISDFTSRFSISIYCQNQHFFIHSRPGEEFPYKLRFVDTLRDGASFRIRAKMFILVFKFPAKYSCSQKPRLQSRINQQNFTKLRKAKISSPPQAVILLHVLTLAPGGQEKQAHTDGGYLCHVASPNREIIWPREMTGLECLLLSSNAITA